MYTRLGEIGVAVHSMINLFRTTAIHRYVVDFFPRLLMETQTYLVFWRIPKRGCRCCVVSRR